MNNETTSRLLKACAALLGAWLAAFPAAVPAAAMQARAATGARGAGGTVVVAAPALSAPLATDAGAFLDSAASLPGFPALPALGAQGATSLEVAVESPALAASAAGLAAPAVAVSPEELSAPAARRGAVATPFASEAGSQPATEERDGGRQAMQAGLTEVRDAVGSVRAPAQSAAGDAFAAGVTVENALTGRRTRAGVGDEAAPVDSTLAGSVSAALGRRPALAVRGSLSQAGGLSAAVPAPAPASFSIGTVLTGLSGQVFSARGFAVLAVGLTVALLSFGAFLPATVSSLGLLLMAGTVAGSRSADEGAGADDAASRPVVVAAEPGAAGEAAPAVEAPPTSPTITIGKQTRTRAEFVAAAREFVAKIKAEIGKKIVGEEEMIDAILLAAISGQHILVEGLPGTGKTTLMKAFAKTVSASFSRIQFTPDLMPSAISGSMMLQEGPEGRKFVFEPGPIFAQIVLADEINRSPPKVKAALLEPMAERQVTVAKQTHQLGKPFMVLATMNPLEQAGAYPLAEAEQDRFMLKFVLPQDDLGDPETRAQFDRIGAMNRKVNAAEPEAVISPAQLLAMGKISESVGMSREVRDYVLNLLEAATFPERYGLGAKLTDVALLRRANIYFQLATRVRAMMQGREFVTPDDVKAVAPMILRHRLKLSFSAGSSLTVEQFVAKLLDVVPVKSKAATALKAEQSEIAAAAERANAPKPWWKRALWKALRWTLIALPIGLVIALLIAFWPNLVEFFPGLGRAQNSISEWLQGLRR